MDLAALQEKINNYITVVSSWVRNVGKLYFSGTAEDVTVQMIDDNGSVVSTTLPNVAQFRKTVWDDVDGALSQFSKNIYVDAVNGDDLNAGTSTSKFKTLDKALDSVPYGGYAIIYLESDQDHYFNGYRTTIGKSIRNSHIIVRVADASLPSPRLHFVFTEDSSASYSSIAQFYFYNSVAYFENIDLIVENYTGTAQVVSENIISASCIGCDVMFSSCKIILGSSGRIIDSSVYGGKSVVFYGSEIITDRGLGSIDINAPMSIYSTGTTISDSNGNALTLQEITSGVVTDVNGVPRNVTSNIVF